MTAGLALAITLAAGIAAQQAPPPPDAAQLVSAAASWTTGFERSLAQLIFRERYEQRTVNGLSRTEANVLLITRGAAGRLVLYRDVYQIDGTRDTGTGGERPASRAGGEAPVTETGQEPPAARAGDEPPAPRTVGEPPVSRAADEPPVARTGRDAKEGDDV